MLRMESENGWWLITHPDHAHLAGEFAAHWGNHLFAAPQPRASVLHGIHAHDDGWAARDARPGITRQGRPAAFSHELVGKYSAFEEIDLEDYLAVRERAVQQLEASDAYAALLVSMHTCNLLTERADRSTIEPMQLPLLDAFLERQLLRQESLRQAARAGAQSSGAHTTGSHTTGPHTTGPHATGNHATDEAILNNFRLLQATDNLSLLSCVAYMQPATLLHPLPTVDGSEAAVAVYPVAPRHFRLDPYPFDQPSLTFSFPARHIEGSLFSTSAELAGKFAAAPVQQLTVTLSS